MIAALSFRYFGHDEINDYANATWRLIIERRRHIFSGNATVDMQLTPVPKPDSWTFMREQARGGRVELSEELIRSLYPSSPTLGVSSICPKAGHSVSDTLSSQLCLCPKKNVNPDAWPNDGIITVVRFHKRLT